MRHRQEGKGKGEGEGEGGDRPTHLFIREHFEVLLELFSRQLRTLRHGLLDLQDRELRREAVYILTTHRARQLFHYYQHMSPR